MATIMMGVEDWSSPPANSPDIDWCVSLKLVSRTRAVCATVLVFVAHDRGNRASCGNRGFLLVAPVMWLP